MIRIVPFEQLTAGQREAAAAILVRAFTHAPAAWHTLEDARAQVATFFEDEDRAAMAALDADTVAGWIGRIRTYSHAFELAVGELAATLVVVAALSRLLPPRKRAVVA